jgi:aminoglycoside phosphotransferase (APT) family kinase protein
MDTMNHVLRQNVRFWLEENHKSIQWLANEIRVSPSLMVRFLTGEQALVLEQMVQIAQLMGVTVEKLITVDRPYNATLSKPASNMSAKSIKINKSLVARLIDLQFPQWAGLPLQDFESVGTDNTIYRLGQDMAVRLPRNMSAIEQVDKEFKWLPILAPHLPLPIPSPLAMGMPGEGYPWRWSVYRWLGGENATSGSIDDLRQAATTLAKFVAALQQIDPAGGPIPGSSRGVPLATRDSTVRGAIAALDNTIDTKAATSAWEAALHLPDWQGPAVWIHGDLHAGNLLVERGKLSAIIDFGCLGVGDPACDLLAAWSILTAETRDVFRAVLMPNDATWARGRGWALSIGLIALPYYQSTNPWFASIARRLIEEVLIDHKNGA